MQYLEIDVIKCIQWRWIVDYPGNYGRVARSAGAANAAHPLLSEIQIIGF
jgi:hypothetical protein